MPGVQDFPGWHRKEHPWLAQQGTRIRRSEVRGCLLGCAGSSYCPGHTMWLPRLNFWSTSANPRCLLRWWCPEMHWTPRRSGTRYWSVLRANLKTRTLVWVPVPRRWRRLGAHWRDALSCAGGREACVEPCSFPALPAVGAARKANTRPEQTLRPEILSVPRAAVQKPAETVHSEHGCHPRLGGVSPGRLLVFPLTLLLHQLLHFRNQTIRRQPCSAECHSKGWR